MGSSIDKAFERAITKGNFCLYLIYLVAKVWALESGVVIIPRAPVVVRGDQGPPDTHSKESISRVEVEGLLKCLYRLTRRLEAVHMRMSGTRERVKWEARQRQVSPGCRGAPIRAPRVHRASPPHRPPHVAQVPRSTPCTPPTYESGVILQYIVMFVFTWAYLIAAFPKMYQGFSVLHRAESGWNCIRDAVEAPHCSVHFASGHEHVSLGEHNGGFECGVPKLIPGRAAHVPGLAQPLQGHEGLYRFDLCRGGARLRNARTKQAFKRSSSKHADKGNRRKKRGHNIIRRALGNPRSVLSYVPLHLESCFGHHRPTAHTTATAHAAN